MAKNLFCLKKKPAKNEEVLREKQRSRDSSFQVFFKANSQKNIMKGCEKKYD